MDFVQVMKDWRRMCKAYTTDDDSCCDGCPVADFREHGCDAIFEMEDSIDWQQYADAIMAWAAEHPVVYPTWKEWLYEQGLMTDVIDGKGGNFLYNLASEPIPADIAQKLGLQPKEV